MDRLVAIVFSHYGLIVDDAQRDVEPTVRGKVRGCVYYSLSVVLDGL